MFSESFAIASDFFVLGLIPSAIAFIVALVSCITAKKERWKTVVFPILAAIGTFIASCILIYVVVLALAAIALIALVGGILCALILLAIHDDL